MPRTVRRQHPVAVTGENGQLTAAASLSRTVLHPDVTGVIDDYKRLTSKQAQMAFADHFLGRTAGVMDEIWPTFYQLLKCVEDAELYRKPGYLAGDRTFGSFKDYFEYRVGRPFVTWIELEQTYHYAQKYAPDLLTKAFTVAAARSRAAGERLQGTVADARYTQSDDDSLHSHNMILQGVTPKGEFSNPTGTRAEYLARRIAKERPDILERMKAGEFRSIHAAALEAGIVPRTKTVRIDDPESAARTLRGYMPRASLLRLAELLTKDYD